MLKEARIVMPHFATETSIAAHAALAKNLVAAFGGFTRFQGSGAWASPDGEVVYDNATIYDIAVDADRDNPYEVLARLALAAGKALGQQSVYIRLPNGNVDIIDVPADKPVETPHSKADRLLKALQGDTAEREYAERGAKKLLDALGIEMKLDNDPLEKAITDAMATGHGAITFVELYGDRVDMRHVTREEMQQQVLPEPGQLWATRGGGKAFVGKRATVHNGGWYATLVAAQPGYRAGFEYIVDHDGRLAGLDPDMKGWLDLVHLLD